MIQAMNRTILNSKSLTLGDPQEIESFPQGTENFQGSLN